MTKVIHTARSGRYLVQRWTVRHGWSAEQSYDNDRNAIEEANHLAKLFPEYTYRVVDLLGEEDDDGVE